MTKKKQYKKRLPTVLPPTPRAGSDPTVPTRADDGSPAAPALPAPRTPDPRPAPVQDQAQETGSGTAPAGAADAGRPPLPQSTADFVREMKERAGVVETAPLAEPSAEPSDELVVEPVVDPVVDPVVEPVVAPVVAPDVEDQAATAGGQATQPVERRRRIGVLALVIGLLLGVAAVGAAYWWSARDDDAPQADGSWAAPEGLDADEGYVETRVRADGTMEVRQWIRADEPLERVTLRVPNVTSAGQLAAEDVEVLADGARVAGRDEITYFAATYDLGGATEVELRYRLVGAVERSSSAAGRALAVATALEARFSPAPARELRVVKAPEVLSLACAPAADVSPVPCGTPDGDGEWHVELAGRRTADRVIASLTVG